MKKFIPERTKAQWNNIFAQIVKDAIDNDMVYMDELYPMAIEQEEVDVAWADLRKAYKEFFSQDLRLYWEE